MVEHPRYCTFKGCEVYAQDCWECELGVVCQGIPEKEVRRDVGSPV